MYPEEPRTLFYCSNSIRKFSAPHYFPQNLFSKDWIVLTTTCLAADRYKKYNTKGLAKKASFILSTTSYIINLGDIRNPKTKTNPPSNIKTFNVTSQIILCTLQHICKAHKNPIHKKVEKRNLPYDSVIFQPSSYQLISDSTIKKHYVYICKQLKQFIAISFLSIFLCANTEIGQLLKLPTLINHYLEHHENKNDDKNGISFLGFLKNHYNENSQHSKTAKHDHQNLPFKTTDCNSINTVIAFVPQMIFTLHTTAVISAKNIACYTEQHYISKSFGSIWQPPKIG